MGQKISQVILQFTVFLFIMAYGFNVMN